MIKFAYILFSNQKDNPQKCLFKALEGSDSCTFWDILIFRNLIVFPKLLSVYLQLTFNYFIMIVYKKKGFLGYFLIEKLIHVVVQNIKTF